MINPQVIVSISPLEQFSYWLAHQPALVSLMLAYGVLSIGLWWFTRGKGFLIAMVSGLFYLAPMVMRLATT